MNQAVLNIHTNDMFLVINILKNRVSEIEGWNRMLPLLIRELSL